MSLSAEANESKKYIGDFLEVSTNVKKDIGIVDGGLEHGALWCSRSTALIIDAARCNSEHTLSINDIKIALDDLEDIEVQDEHKWALSSAKAFLMICDKHALTISFSV